MWYTFQLLLTKKSIDENDIESLIKKVSEYNGIFKKWKIIVSISNNKIEFYLKTQCHLPSFLPNQNTFLIKATSNITLEKFDFPIPLIKYNTGNIIDLISYFKLKKNKKIKYIEITLNKKVDKIKINTNLYMEYKEKIYKYRLLFTDLKKILKIDFNKNNSLSIISSPKYLDINKALPILTNYSDNALFKIDAFPYIQNDVYLNLNNYDFAKHSLVIGASGSGKSKFISLLVSNIFKNKELKQKYKVVIIDPHASVENEIGLLGKVIDFKTKEDTINLFLNKKEDVIVTIELLLSLFKDLLDTSFNKKLERVLRHSIHLLLVDEDFSFPNLRKIILDLEYRNSLIKKHEDNIAFSVIDFFLSDFNELKTRAYTEAISPIIAFIDEVELFDAFSKMSNNNLKQCIEDNFLTIFSLDRLTLGDNITKTTSGLITEQLLMLVQDYTFAEHIIFMIDEVSVVENPILKRFLSEARKYNLSLILIGQYFNQISSSLRDAIYSNVSNYYIFRSSQMDANILMNNFNMKIALNDKIEEKVKLITSLNNRECVIRVEKDGKLLPAIRGRTMDFVSMPREKKKIEGATILNKKEEISKPKTTFSVGNINLKDILTSNTTSRKEL